MGIKGFNQSGDTFRNKFVRAASGDSTGLDAVTPSVQPTPGGIDATGGTIMEWYDPTPDTYYRVHIFEASGDFEVRRLATEDGIPDNVEFLLIAGGGGGGGSSGGAGGGAGAVLHHPAFPVSVATFPVVIGAGGAGLPTTSSAGGPATGTNSTIGGPNPTVTAPGGGGGGGGDGYNGANGGSGGGSSGGGAATYGGTATSNKSNYTGAGTATAYGNSGGRGYHNPANFVNGGGGGGAGAVGLDSPTGNHPQPQNDGGAGKPFSLTGTPIWFAGGGGGGGHYTGSTQGRGGRGGGGGGSGNNYDTPSVLGGGDGWSAAYAGTRGSGTNPGGNAAKSTGSGGGGAGGTSGGAGGNGGPGIAIFKYEITAPEYQNPTQASGGDVYYTSDKTIHVFKASGSLVAPATFGSKTAEYVVIGGGGGGANDIGGGGGAGTWKEGTTPLSSNTTYPIEVGAAGCC